MMKARTNTAVRDVDATLARLTARYGDAFEVTTARIHDRRAAARERHLSDDTCVTCDVPQDVCTSCDAGDVTCNNQHDIVCIRCDEGDVCTRSDGSCNIIGDIPCGKQDKE